MTEQNVAVQVAKQKKETVVDDEFDVMGVHVSLVAVPVGLVQDAQSHIKPPKVPSYYNEDKGREEENPTHPDYLNAVQEYEEKRTQAALDTMIMFGIELDGLPTDDSWLKRIKLLGKRGTLELSNVDFDDSIEQEFLFKKYVVATTSVIQAIGAKTGVSREAIAQAKAGFRR